VRVLHVHATPGAVGGSERTLLLAVSGLRALGVENHLLYDGPPPPEPSDFVGLSREPGAFLRRQTPASLVRSHRRIASYVREHRIDLIHVRLWDSMLLRSTLLRAAPTVATAHLPLCPNGARFQYGNERPCEERMGRVCVTLGRADYRCGFTAALDPFGPLGLERGLIRAKAELRLLRAYCFVMAPSEWQRQRLASDGLPPDQIVVVPSPVEASGLDGRSAARLTPPVVFFAARLVRFKGAHHLLEAVARLGTDVDVQIAGDGPEAGALGMTAERLGIADRVTFLGAIGPSAMQERYRQATVVAVPSLWPETFNRVGPEALAAGTPVVAYASGGVGEWLRLGETGISVPVGDVEAFADALREVIHGGVLSEVVRRRGPIAAAEFSVRNHAQAVEACYEATLAQSATA
jgi:glycosyltransferase involved in cell wall biosynthesis